MREEEQLRLAETFAQKFYDGQPFSEEFLRTGQFTCCDAITLYSMIRNSAPKRIIEVGSGRSSRVILETNP